MNSGDCEPWRFWFGITLIDAGEKLSELLKITNSFNISVEEIKEVIASLAKREIGVLITDHNVRETLDICERAYIINAGEKIASGKPADILKDDLVKKVYLGDQFKI